jgi:transcriptional regulator with XRE-family HTH domain
MIRDWERLAEAIKAARKARGWTQKDLAATARVGFSTVQRLESGKPASRTPASLPHVERALGWAHGSVEDILAGGEPTPEGTPEGQLELTQVRGTAPTLAAGMPLRVIQELTEGEVLDTEVLDLSRPGSDTRMVVVIKRGATDASPDQIREDLEVWTRVQRELRRITSATPDTDSDAG